MGPREVDVGSPLALVAGHLRDDPLPLPKREFEATRCEKHVVDEPHLNRHARRFDALTLDLRPHHCLALTDPDEYVTGLKGRDLPIFTEPLKLRGRDGSSKLVLDTDPKDALQMGLHPSAEAQRRVRDGEFDRVRLGPVVRRRRWGIGPRPFLLALTASTSGASPVLGEESVLEVV